MGQTGWRAAKREQVCPRWAHSKQLANGKYSPLVPLISSLGGDGGKGGRGKSGSDPQRWGTEGVAAGGWGGGAYRTFFPYTLFLFLPDTGALMIKQGQVYRKCEQQMY